MGKRTLRGRRYADQGRKAARRTGEKIRLLAFGFITMAVFALAAYFLWPAIRPLGEGSPGAVTVQLSMGGYSPAHIEARAGVPVTLRLVNKDDQFHTDGGGWHQLAVDELGINVKVPPSTNKEFTFTPTSSGTFQFYRDVCCGGRANPAMVGTLMVGS